jgi:hypothetical protein
MAQLIVISKIDGNPVAWRCSDCGQVFSILGQLTTDARRKRVAGAFKAHLNQVHADVTDMPVSLIQA